MSCKCATLDEDTGRYECSVSGDQCMYLFPDSKQCAKDYGEGPDAVDNSDKEMDCLACTLNKEDACADCCRDWDNEEEDL